MSIIRRPSHGITAAIVWCLSLGSLGGPFAATPAAAEVQRFTGAGAGEPPWMGLANPWVRPAIGSLPASDANWESTPFYVSRTGTYRFENVVTSRPDPVPFPRILYLYAHDFDPARPARNRVATVDLSDGSPSATVDWTLLADNIYHLVLSSIDETLPEDASGFLPPIVTTVSGPGRIGNHTCRFTDDVISDAIGDVWDQEAGMALQDGSFAAEQICIRVAWEDADGVSHTARVAPQRTTDSVLFTFFSPQNWEISAKLLDGCEVNGRYWLLASASTDVSFRIDVRFLGYDAFVNPDNPHFEPYVPGEPTSGGELVYRSAGGEASRAIIDVDAVICSSP